MPTSAGLLFEQVERILVGLDHERLERGFFPPNGHDATAHAGRLRRTQDDAAADKLAQEAYLSVNRARLELLARRRETVLRAAGANQVQVGSPAGRPGNGNP